MMVRTLYFRTNVSGASADKGQAVARTREGWLIRLVDELRPMFEKIGHPIPKQIRVTCGWPSIGARAPLHKTLGECWPPVTSADQTVEIFISPCLGDGIEAGECLVHELIHAGGVTGHRSPFSKIA